MKDRRFVEFASCRTKGALAEKRLFSVTSRGLQITHQKSDICHSQYVARNSCSNQKCPSMHGRVFIYSRVKRTFEVHVAGVRTHSCSRLGVR